MCESPCQALDTESTEKQGKAARMTIGLCGEQNSYCTISGERPVVGAQLVCVFQDLRGSKIGHIFGLRNVCSRMRYDDASRENEFVTTAV